MQRPVILLLLVALALSATACGRSVPSRYYVLDCPAEAVHAENLPQLTLRVARVNIPPYLDRAGIVSRERGHARLDVAEAHLWAEPLAEGVRRIIQETLTPPLLQAGMTVLPLGNEKEGAYILLIDIQRLEGTFDGPANLIGRWEVIDEGERCVGNGIYTASGEVQGHAYGQLVEAESRLIREFALYLTEKLKLLARKGTP